MSCNHDCSNCGEKCESKTINKEALNPNSKVNKVIGVVSGKGGVGKSFVTSILAVIFNRMGYKTAILDADLTGPSIPKAFGLTEKIYNGELGMIPAKTKTGIEIMSINLMLKDERDPVVWRGPIIASTVKQFWSDTVWEDIDYMFIDMPPGTGDVPLTVFQSIPVDGIVVVTSPQELVSMIVEKAVKMAELMKVPILGLVENYSYFECPECKKKYNILGNSNIDEISKHHNLDVLAKIPIVHDFADLIDKGLVELFKSDCLDECVNIIENKLNDK